MNITAVIVNRVHGGSKNVPLPFVVGSNTSHVTALTTGSTSHVAIAVEVIGEL